MKTRAFNLALLGFSAFLLQGCINIPPLIQVEHKDSCNSNDAVLRRLDAIDQRLSQLEQKVDKNSPPPQAAAR